MAYMSKSFNFDAFDELCREALDEQLMHESEELEEEQIWAEHDRVFYPGEIGGVVCKPSFDIEPVVDTM